MSVSCRYFTPIFKAPKIPKKSYKKSARRKLLEPRRRTWGAHLAPRRPGGATPSLAAPPGRLGGEATPWLPPLAYITSSSRIPSRRSPHHEFPHCSVTAALPRSAASEDLFPAPYRREY